jgi:hypothetical protein
VHHTGVGVAETGAESHRTVCLGTTVRTTQQLHDLFLAKILSSLVLAAVLGQIEIVLVSDDTHFFHHRIQLLAGAGLGRLVFPRNDKVLGWSPAFEHHDFFPPGFATSQ